MFCQVQIEDWTHNKTVRKIILLTTYSNQGWKNWYNFPNSKFSILWNPKIRVEVVKKIVTSSTLSWPIEINLQHQIFYNKKQEEMLTFPEVLSWRNISGSKNHIPARSEGKQLKFLSRCYSQETLPVSC